jgi:hypothetical protein
MKKLMLILLIAMAVPAMAAVTFTAVDDGAGNLVISYTSDGDGPRGVALSVVLVGGTVDPANPGVVDPAFNTFVDFAHSNPLNFAVGMGHALAKADGPGALDAPAAAFSISCGVLDEAGNQAAGPDAATLITLPIICDGGGTEIGVTISGDTLRGPASGVVGDVVGGSDLDTADITLIMTSPCGEVPCVPEADVAEWEAVGKPQSWCTEYQCEGDADGLPEGNPITGFYQVGVNDLNVLIAGWKNVDYVDPATTPWIAADFDRKQEGNPITGFYRVGVNDLNRLIANWKTDENLVGVVSGNYLINKTHTLYM